MNNQTYQLPFKQNANIAEIGGGQTPNFRPNIDIRKFPNVDIVADFNKGLPVPDNSYDGIFSKYLLEHISWRRVRNFLKEVLRILKPNGTAVFITANLVEQARAIVNARELNDDLICMVFGGQKFGESTNLNDELEDDWDANSHHSGFSPEFISKVLNEIGYKSWKIFPIQTVHGITDMIIEATKFDKNPNQKSDIIIPNISVNDDKIINADPSKQLKLIDAEFKEVQTFQSSIQSSHDIKLNIGSFTVMHRHDWINLDILNLSQYANENKYIFRQTDCSSYIPYNDNEVSLITASHFIEHLTKDEGKQFLRESLRVLKPGGLIRLTIPDAEIIAKDYLSGNISRHASHNEGVKNAQSDTESLFHLLISGHKTIYDTKSLTKLLKDAGFIDIEKMEYQKSKSPIIEKENIDMYPELSLYIEAMKPNLQPIYSTNTTTNTNIYNENRKLKVALISTPFFKVPPDSYGGLEQVLWDLAVGLDELGHEVTIFGPKGSYSTVHGNLIEICDSNDTVNVDWYKLEQQNYEKYKDFINPDKYDIIHDSTWFAFSYLLKQKYPSINILHHHHGGYSWTTLPPFGKTNLVAISKFMKEYTEQYFKKYGYNIQSEYVHNGIDLDKYPFQQTKTEHLLFVGRLSTFKHPELAIEVAKKSNYKLDIVGGSKFVDNPAYVEKLDKLVEKDPDITIYKDVSHQFKIEKMQNAKAILIPSQMNEPLNLVSIEGQSCGTAIIALRDGGLPETIIQGKTGFVCNNIDEMVHNVLHIQDIKPEDCRKNIEENFSRLTMAKNFEKLYYKMMNGQYW